MLRARCILFVAATLATLGAGCRHGHTPPQQAPEQITLPIVPRSSWKLEAVVTERPGELVRADSIYQSLSDRQAQCLASARSSKANMLDEEAEAIGAARGNLIVDLITREHRNRPLKQEILRTFALEERNQSAGQALETFHRLVEAEAKADVLRSALNDLNTAVREVEKRRALGLPVSPELEGIEAQRLKVQQDSVRLEQGIDQGTESLAMLIGADNETHRRFLPQVDWRPDLKIPDEKAAIDDALQNRPGRRLTQTLSRETDIRTLSAVKLFLQTVGAASGSSTTPPPTLIGIVTRFAIVGGGGREEAESRQAQMNRINSETERLIVSEVTQALSKMQAQKDLIELARRKLVRDQNRLKDLEAKQGQGLAAPIQLLTVRQQVRQDEVELIEEIAGWHVAKVKLRRAQGHLVLECGSEARCGSGSRCGGCNGCGNQIDYRRLPADLTTPTPPQAAPGTYAPITLPPVSVSQRRMQEEIIVPVEMQEPAIPQAAIPQRPAPQPTLTLEPVAD